METAHGCLQLEKTTVNQRNGKRERNEESIEKEESTVNRSCNICWQQTRTCSALRSMTRMRIIDFFLGTNLVHVKGSRKRLYICRSHHYEEFEKKTEEILGTRKSVEEIDGMITSGVLKIPGLERENARSTTNYEVAPSSDSSKFTPKNIHVDRRQYNLDSEEANSGSSGVLDEIREVQLNKREESHGIQKNCSRNKFRLCQLCHQRTDAFYSIGSVNKLHIIDFVLGTNLVHLLGTRQYVYICRTHYFEEFEKRTEEIYGSRRSVDSMYQMMKYGGLTIPMKMEQPEETDKSPICLVDKCDLPLEERRIKLEEKEEVFRMSGENNNQSVKIPGLKTDLRKITDRGEEARSTRNYEAAPSASDYDGLTSKSISLERAVNPNSEDTSTDSFHQLNGIQMNTRVDLVGSNREEVKRVKRFRWCTICDRRTDSFYTIRSVDKMRIIDFVLGTNLLHLLGTRQSLIICRWHYYDEFEMKAEQLYGSMRSVDSMCVMIASGVLTIPMKMGQPVKTDKSPICLVDKCDSPLEEKEEKFRMSGENNNQLVGSDREMNGGRLQKVEQEEMDDIKPNTFNEYEMVDVEQLMGRF